MARLILSEDNPEPEAIPELEILVPSDAGDVGLFYEVTVRVKSTYSGDVQVLVRGGGIWWLQGHMERAVGRLYKLRCQFGKDSMGLGERFEIVAVARCGDIPLTSYSLPDRGDRSNIVSVRRTLG
jgi:hypothetical protein